MDLDTRTYPIIKNLMKNVDFKCENCTSGQGQDVYVTLEQAEAEPGHGHTGFAKDGVTKKNFTDSFGVLCPYCYCAPTEHMSLGFENGKVDLMKMVKFFPEGVKRPKREVASVRGAIRYDDEDEGVLRKTRKARGPQKKKSDLATA